MTFIHRLFADKRGVTAIEYALIASLISVAAIAGYQTLGNKVESSFNNTAEKL